MEGQIYFIETKAINTALISRIARLKIIAGKGSNRLDAEAAGRLIKKYGY